MRQALERQKEQDALTTALKKAELAESGWMEEPQFEAQRNAAGLGLGSTLASALQVAGGGSPLTPQGDMSSLSRGTLTQKPAGKITFGGSNLVLPETQAMRQERIGKAASYDAQQKAQRAQEAAIAERERRVATLVSAGVDRNLAVKAVELDAKFGDVEETPGVRVTKRGQDISAATARRGQDISAETARMSLAQREAKASDKKAQAQEGLQAMLPTITAAAKDIGSWGEKEIKQLSPTAIAALNQASLQGGLTGVFLSSMASQMTSPLDRRYLQYAASVADAVARASEVGVLTNQDINRFRNQVLFIGGEELGDKRFKVNNLKSWANWLSTNKGALSSGEAGRQSLSLMPGETEEEAQQLRGWTPANPKGQDVFSRAAGMATPQAPSAGAFGMPTSSMSQDPDYASGLDAIRRGADRAEVIARYESTGKKWPGGR